MRWSCRSPRWRFTVDHDYFLPSIATPLAETPEGYPPAMPALNLSVAEQKALVEWIKTLK